MVLDVHVCRTRLTKSLIAWGNASEALSRFAGEITELSSWGEGAVDHPLGGVGDVAGCHQSQLIRLAEAVIAGITQSVIEEVWPDPLR